MTNVLRVLWAFLVRDYVLATAYRLAFVLSIGRAVFPLLVLYLPAKLMGDVASTREFGGFLPFSVIGLGTMNFFMASYGSFANSLRLEQSMGTLESVLLSPISLSTLVLASSCWGFLWSTATAVLFIGGGALLYGIPLTGSFALALLFIAVTTLLFVGIGVLSASFAMVWKRGDPIGPIVSGTFFLLGGIIYPPEILPGWLTTIAYLLPVTHGVEALREVLLQGKGFSDVSGHLWVLTGWAAVLLPASLLAFARAVRRASRDGTLLQF
ncbi:MAG: ABC transporter permease [Polyangiales bacterium]